MLCKRKKVNIKKFEVDFIGLCTKGEGLNYKTVSGADSSKYNFVI